MTLATILIYLLGGYAALGVLYFIVSFAEGCTLRRFILDACWFLGWLAMAILGWPLWIWEDRKWRRRAEGVQ